MASWLLPVLLVVEALDLGLVAALASPAGHCTGAGCFTVATELSKCKSPEVVSLVKSYSRYSSQLQGREHSKISLHKSSSTSYLNSLSATSQVEVSANVLTLGFVLQVFSSSDDLATSRFVHEAPAGTQGGAGKQKITSCNRADDTIVRLASTPGEKTIAVTLFSTNVTAATYLRYFIVDDNHQVHTGTLRVSLQSPLGTSYESQEHPDKNLVRKKRALVDDPSAQLLIANGDYLHLSSLDGSRTHTLVLVNHTDDNILSIDYNYRQRFVYWGDNRRGRIMRSNMDGSMAVPVLEEGLDAPEGIAMDWVTNKIYFTDAGLEIVGVFDVENSWYKVLLDDTFVGRPRAIVVDPAMGWMYWTDQKTDTDNARIEKASMDGSNHIVLHSTGLTQPNGLTIDYDRQVLYWVDSSVGVLQSSYVNGSNRITILGSTGLSSPYGVSYFNGEVFYSDWSSDNVQSITVPGASVRPVFNDSCLSMIFELAVVSEQRQTEMTNPCSNNSCSHLCLLSASDPQGYTCHCPEGFNMTIDQQNCNQQPNATDYSLPPQGSCVAAGHSTCCVSDDCTGNSTVCYCDANCHLFGDCCRDVSPDCLNAEPSPYLVYTSEFFIHRISARSAGDTEARLRAVVSGISSAADIDFHYGNGHLYWTDTSNDAGKIWRSNFDGTGLLMILDTGTSQPPDVAVDWVTNKLYWVNGTDSTINVFDLSTGNQGTLLSVEGTITDLALDPLSSEMYWSVSGSTPMIEKASMNGQNRAVFQMSSMGLPSSLFIDFSQSVVYWADTQQNMVERSNFDGTARTVVYSSSELPTAPGLSTPLSPLSLVIHENALYYVGQFVGVATATGSSSRSVLNYDVGCTQGGGIQLISSSRQPQASNPCATSNGGCASSEICVLSSIGGMACISTDVTLPPPPPLGTCAAAGITGCCVNGSCEGNPPTCSCTSDCVLFRDCCEDAVSCVTTRPTDSVTTEPSSVTVEPSLSSVTIKPSLSLVTIEPSQPLVTTGPFLSLVTIEPSPSLVTTGPFSSLVTIEPSQPLVPTGSSSSLVTIEPSPSLVTTGPSSSLVTIELSPLLVTGPSSSLVTIEPSPSLVTTGPSSSLVTIEPSPSLVTTGPPPILMFVLTPNNSSVPEFQQQVVFRCEVNAPTASITWYFTQRGSNEPVLLSGQSANYSVQNGDGFSQLTVLRVEFPRDQGEYRCDAANNGESISASAQLNVLDGCNSEEYQGVIWPETNLGSTANVPCPCLEIVGESAGRGSRLCGGTFSQGAVWSSDVDLSNCFTSMSAVSQQLCDIALLLGDSSNSTVQVSGEIVNITSQSQNLTSNDISTATTVIEQLGREAVTNPEVRENYLQTIDNIMLAEEDAILESQMATNSSVRILDSLGTFLDNLDLTTVSEYSPSNQTTLNFTNYVLQVQEIDSENFNGQTFIVDLGSVEQAMNISGGIDPDALITVDDVSISARRRRLSEEGIQNSTAFLQLFPSFFDECVNSEISNLSSATSQRLSYSVFVRDTLFLPENRTLNAIGSIIVAARVRCELANKTILSMPVRSSFQVSTPERAINSSCAVYNTKHKFGEWDPSGCRKVKRHDGRTDCECTQLGHFGILFDLDPTPLEKEAALALGITTYVGLAASFFCLAVFIFTDLISKELRSKTHNQVLVNMSISLMGLYIMFLIGGFTTRVPPLCGIVSALLHYFFLVFFCWTAVEAILLYLKLVTVLGSQSFSSNYMLKAGPPAWLIPAVIVIISGGVGHEYYVSRFYCRPTKWPFYFGYILPFLVVYTFNWIMFSFIMVSLCKHARETVVLKDNLTTGTVRGLLKKNFIAAVSLAVVLGLGWGIGLAATSSDIKELTITLQGIFSVFVGSQGVLIFIIHGVRNADFRKFWMKLLRIRKSRSKSAVVSFDRGNKAAPRDSGSGSCTDFAAPYTQLSIPENSNKSSSGSFMSDNSSNSTIQSPVDSVFAHESEVFPAELPPDAESESGYRTSQPRNSTRVTFMISSLLEEAIQKQGVDEVVIKNTGFTKNN